MPLPIIDCHIHVWNFSRARYSWLDGNTSLLNRNYAIEELEEPRLKAGVTGGVLVQAANNLEDTEFMLDTARQTSWIKGVVGWLPLTDPVACARLLEDVYGKESLLKGIRHLIHDETDDRWLLQAEVVESLSILSAYNLTYDLVGIKTTHIETALALAEKVPGLRMVFDHLNQPPLKPGEDAAQWRMLMLEASKNPNFFAKISGLGTIVGGLNDNTKAWLLPGLDFVFQNFGFERCICGGDWPVSLLADDYEQVWNIYRAQLGVLLNEFELEQVLSKNAEAFYHL